MTESRPRGRNPRADAITAAARRSATFTNEEATAHLAEQAQLMADYYETFSPPHGQRVLAHLEQLAREPTFFASNPDPNVAIGRTYKAEMLTTIIKMINGGKA